jgi:hypothetical protein
MLTQSALKELLHYDPDKGLFSWRINAGRRKAGDVAGSIRTGYRVIGIDGALFSAARLAFLYVTGDLPSGTIGRINGKPDDLR